MGSGPIFFMLMIGTACFAYASVGYLSEQQESWLTVERLAAPVL